METLLTSIEAFTTRHGLSASAFGDAALGDRHLVRNLREGRELRRATEQKVRTFMAEYRAPAQAEAA